MQLGSDAGMAYLTGFLVEKSLALDNVFVISLIFAYFAVPSALQLLTVMLPLQLLLALILLLFMVATATAGFGRFFEASLAFLDTGG